MSLKVLELNDHGVTLSDDSGVLARSPGFVLDQEGEIVFGDSAVAGSRLYPVSVNNEFWHHLSMEALSRPLAHFRHHADMAHAHLLHIAETAAAEGELIVLVPGSFSREQLSILVGMLRHSPFQPLALVDSAAVAGLARLKDRPGLHLDLQLHQMVLSLVHHEPGSVQCSQLIQLPDLGWSQLSNTLAQMVTDAFVRQCRFNPQHNAAWEQHLHDQLPGWLRQQADSDGNLVLEISNGETRHRARLPRSEVEMRLQGQYRKILQSLPAAAQGKLLVTERCAGLPGLIPFLRTELPRETPLDERPLGSSVMVQSALLLREQLPAEDGTVHFISALSTGSVTAAEASAAAPAHRRSGEQAPTHILWDHHAWRLPAEGVMLRGDKTRGLGLESISGQDEEDASVLGKIVLRGGQFLLHCSGSALRLNDREVGDAPPLKLGDRIEVEGNTVLLMIRVHDDQE